MFSERERMRERERQRERQRDRERQRERKREREINASSSSFFIVEFEIIFGRFDLVTEGGGSSVEKFNSFKCY